jgi:hypothetical protein
MTKRLLPTMLGESNSIQRRARLCLGDTKFIANSSAAVRLPPKRTPQRRLI